MTATVERHNIIMAFAKSKARVLDGAGSTTVPTEGTFAFVFPNTSNIIAVGEHVFISDHLDDDIQYLGKCRVSGTAGITTERCLQNTPGTSSKLWTPTTYFAPTYGTARSGGMTRGDNLGTRESRTLGADMFICQYADPSAALVFQIAPTAPIDYQNWLTFLTTGRSNGTQSFSVGYFDYQSGLSKVAECLNMSGHLSSVMQNGKITSFSITLFIKTTDTYVAS